MLLPHSLRHGLSFSIPPILFSLSFLSPHPFFNSPFISFAIPSSLYIPFTFIFYRPSSSLTIFCLRFYLPLLSSVSPHPSFRLTLFLPHHSVPLRSSYTLRSSWVLFFHTSLPLPLFFFVPRYLPLLCLSPSRSPLLFLSNTPSFTLSPFCLVLFSSVPLPLSHRYLVLSFL